MRLQKWLWPALVVGPLALMHAAAATADGIPRGPLLVPGSLGSLPLHGLRDFEPDAPGLGWGARYARRGLTVSVYVYSGGRPSVPDGPRSGEIGEEISNALGEIDGHLHRGTYESVEPMNAFEVNAQGQACFAARSMRIRWDGRSRFDVLALTGLRRHFVKVRMSWPGEPSDGEKAAADILRLLCRELWRLNPVRAAMRRRGRRSTGRLRRGFGSAAQPPAARPIPSAARGAMIATAAVERRRDAIAMTGASTPVHDTRAHPGPAASVPGAAGTLRRPAASRKRPALSTRLGRLIVAFLALGSATGALACSLAHDQATDIDYFHWSREVFLARVVSISVREVAVVATEPEQRPFRLTERKVWLEVLEVLKGSPPRFITFEDWVNPKAKYVCQQPEHEPRIGGEYLYVRGVDPAAGTLPDDPPYWLRRLEWPRDAPLPAALTEMPWPYTAGPSACGIDEWPPACVAACRKQLARLAKMRRLAAATGRARGIAPAQTSAEHRAYSRYLLLALHSPDRLPRCRPRRAIASPSIAGANLAFVARHTSVEIVGDAARGGRRAATNEFLLLRYRVETPWKGNPPAAFTIRVELPREGDCYRNFTPGGLAAFYLNAWRDPMSIDEARPMADHGGFSFSRSDRADVARRRNVCGLPGRSDEDLVHMSKQIVRVEVLEPCLPNGCTPQVRVKEVIKGAPAVPERLALCWSDTVAVEAFRQGGEYVVFIMHDGPPYEGRAQAAYEYTGGSGEDLRTAALKRFVARERVQARR